MLNKKICKKCIEEHEKKKCGYAYVGGKLDYFISDNNGQAHYYSYMKDFNSRWRANYPICMSLHGTVQMSCLGIMSGAHRKFKPPDFCPFKLEHLLIKKTILERLKEWVF